MQRAQQHGEPGEGAIRVGVCSAKVVMVDVSGVTLELKPDH